MKGRAIIPLAVGLLVGVVALKIFADVLRKARGSTSGNEVANVVCANSDIAPTAEIKETMLELRSVPKALQPKAVFTDLKEVAGRVSCVNIPKGMPIVPNLLAPKGTMPGLAVRIREGYRAVAVKIDESSGVAGWLKPGCHVDVVAVMQTDGYSSSRGTISKVILENVEVLAVGQDIGTAGEVGASVTKSATLAVLPQDVPKLHLAATKGTLRLAMRNLQDFASASDGETTDKELLGGSSSKVSQTQGKSTGILSSLFGKQPKTDAHKTDKDHEALSAGYPVPATAMASAQGQPWRVELLVGAQHEEIWFDGRTEGASRLEMKSDGRSRSSGPVSHSNLWTSPAAAQNAGNVPDSGESSRPTEPRE